MRTVFMDLHEVELRFIKSFVVRDRQERYVTLLAIDKPRARRKFLDQLTTTLDRDLDPIWTVDRYSASPKESQAGTVEEVLKRLGAPEMCWVTSYVREFDGKMLPLGTALRDTMFSYVGSIVHCIPGQLAFYSAECQHFVCQRKLGACP